MVDLDADVSFSDFLSFIRFMNQDFTLNLSALQLINFLIFFFWEVVNFEIEAWRFSILDCILSSL